MELAMQLISNCNFVKKTIQDLKKFNSQSIATQAKKGDHLVSMGLRKRLVYQRSF